MGCFGSRCCDDDDEEPKSMASIEKNRSCTDVLFLLLFIAWWGAVITLISVSYENGADLERLQFRTDYKGDICGGPNNEGKEVAMFLLPLPEFSSLFVCLESCDQVRNPFYLTDQFNYNATRFMNLCVPPPTVIGEIFLESGASEEFANGMADLERAIPLLGAAVVVAFVLGFLYTFFLRMFAAVLVWAAVFLILLGSAGGSAVLFLQAQQMEADGTSTRAQVQVVQGLSAVFLAISVIFLLIVIALRKRIAIAIEVVKEASRAIVDVKALVLFPILVMAVGVAYGAFWVFGALSMFSIQDTVITEVDRAYHAPIAFAFLAQGLDSPINITHNITLPSFEQIRDDPDSLADLVQVNSSFSYPEYSFSDEMQRPLAVHFFHFLWNVQFLIYFTYAVVAGTIADCYPEYSFSDEMQRPLAVHFFHFLWNVQFLIYFTYAFVAGTIADWYFTPRNENGNKIVGLGKNELSPFPVLSAVTRIARYHLGTIAFGSFIIAVVQFIRAVVKYIEKQTEMKNNRLQKMIFCMIQCCLWCLQKILDRISKNAIIWNAIYGSNFCRSSLGSFVLIMRNILRATAISGVSGYLLAIGRFTVPIVNTGIFAVLLIYVAPFNETVGSPVLPLLVVFIMSYLVIALFLEVYEGTIDTIFLCFLIDDKENGKGQMMASEGLQRVINKFDKHSKDKKRSSKSSSTSSSSGKENEVEIEIADTNVGEKPERSVEIL